MRTLPRTKASPAFTAEVLRRVGQTESRKPFVWRAAAAFAMAMIVVGIVHVAVMERARQQRFATLRAEQQKIEAELEAVKKIATEAEPVVVLEDTSDGTRVIMDLDSAVQHASLKTFD
jgi:hypothetical protein